MEDNMHPLTELMIKRIETHPEEFVVSTNESLAVFTRWDKFVRCIQDNETSEAIALLNAALGKATLDIAHRDALDELMNGPERRADMRLTEEKFHAAKMQAAVAQQLADMQASQQLAQAQSAALRQQSVLGSMTQSLDDAFRNAYGSAISGGGSAVR